MGSRPLNRLQAPVSSGLYLLDTTVLIDVSRRRQSTLSWLDSAIRGPAEICVCAIAVAEFFAGLRPEQRRQWKSFIDELTHWDVTKDIAVLAGSLRYDLARRGQSLKTPDALIAATALMYEAELVTANIRDFAATGVESILLSS